MDAVWQMKQEEINNVSVIDVVVDFRVRESW